MSSVLLLSLSAFLLPPLLSPLSSLANKASDPRLSEAAPVPGLFTEAVPVSPRSLAIFQDLSPVTSYTCKYNGLGDYWAINNNARKVQKGVDLGFFSLS